MGNINTSGGFTKKNDSVAFKYEVKDDGTLFASKQEAHDYNATARAPYRSLGDRRRVENPLSPFGYDLYEYTGINAAANADITKLVKIDLVTVVSDNNFDNTEDANVIFTQVGNKVRATLNWNGVFLDPSVIPATANAVATHKFVIDAINAALGIAAPSPSNVSNLLHWFKSDSGVVQVNGIVDSIANKVSGGVSLVASGSGKPSLLSVEAPNGIPYLHFDGADDKLQADVFAIPANTPDLTIFSIIRTTGTTRTIYELSDVNGSWDTTVTGLVSAIDQSKLVSIVHGDGGTVGFANPNIPPVGFFINRSHYWLSEPMNTETLTAINGNIDGYGIGAGPNNSGNFPTNIALSVGAGKSQYFSNMDLSALIVYGKKLTAAEINTVEAYLKGKYGMNY